MTETTSSSKLDTGKNPMTFTILPPECDEGKDFVSEPPMAKEKTSIWMRQVLIPFTLFGKLLAFLEHRFRRLSHNLTR